MSMLERLVERLTELNIKRDQLITEGMEIFERSLLTLIRRYPLIQNIHWTQYTPHFNDGSPCTFSVGYLYVKIHGINYSVSDHPNNEPLLHADEYENDNLSEEEFGKKLTPEQIIESHPEMCKELLQLQNTLQVLQDVVYEQFGDHKAVTVDRDGVSTEDCEHD